MKKSNRKVWEIINYIIDYLPLLGTIIAATFATFAAVRKTISGDEVLQWVLIVLALLATTQLIDRFRVLQGLDRKTSAIIEDINALRSTSFALKKRMDLPKVSDQAKHASEIAIIGVAGGFVIAQHLNFYERKIQQGCKIKIILLDPASPNIQNWVQLNKGAMTGKRIEATLDTLREFLSRPGMEDGCEVRLSSVLLPFSMFSTNMTHENGVIVVEYYAYNISVDERPHIILTPYIDSHWFEHYHQQFNSIWLTSKKWESKSHNNLNAS